MRQKSMSKNDPAERTVRDIRRKTRKQYTAEEKIRIVVSGLRGEERSPPCAAALAGTIPIKASATAPEGYDKAKLENGVFEPLRELGLIDGN